MKKLGHIKGGKLGEIFGLSFGCQRCHAALLHAKHRCIVYQTDQTGLISAASVWGDQ